MSTPPNKGDQKAEIERLLQEGITAAKAGDKMRARANFQQVVGLDQYSEQGWMLLANVVDSADEKRIALGNVAVINPDNKAAQRMLEELVNPKSRPVPPMRTDAELGAKAPTTNRQRLILMAGAGAVLLVVLLAIIVAALNGLSGPPPIPTLNSVAAAATNAPTDTETATSTSTATLSNSSGPATDAADFTTATFAPGVRVATLPSSWTPQPTITIRGPYTSTALPPPPAGVTGHLIIAASTFPTLNQSLTLSTIDPSGSGRKAISPGDVGDFGIMTPDDEKFIFARYIAGTDAQQIRVVNVTGTQPTELASLWNNQPSLADQEMPSISRNGLALVFVALSLSENDSTPDIYYVPVKFSPPGLFTATPTITPTETITNTAVPATKVRGTEPPTSTSPSETPTTVPITPTLTATSIYATVRRLTAKDSGINLWPAISPDGQTVVYSNSKDGNQTVSAILYSMAVVKGTPTPLTSDMSDAVSAAPEWSPDGTQIAFQSQAAGATTNDIYLMNADGSNKRRLITGSDNIRPHWSPDGKYLAFSSTRTGKYEVFVTNAQTGVIYQVTQTTVPTICTGWGS